MVPTGSNSVHALAADIDVRWRTCFAVAPSALSMGLAASRSAQKDLHAKAPTEVGRCPASAKPPSELMPARSVNLVASPS